MTPQNNVPQNSLVKQLYVGTDGLSAHYTGTANRDGVILQIQGGTFPKFRISVWHIKEGSDRSTILPPPVWPGLKISFGSRNEQIICSGDIITPPSGRPSTLFITDTGASQSTVTLYTIEAL
ncbi:hypothetical protein PT277_01765 [Acetobacteraceae bacterium ESL0709]|nr:hypothetical protein [Acetobacteraceae bacterium ESL0709]